MSVATSLKPAFESSKPSNSTSAAAAAAGPSSAATTTTTTSEAAKTLANLEAEAGDISSPHELTDWVDKVLDQLTHRFDDMRGQVEARMQEMSTRIDNLETSIEDLIQGALAPIPSGTTASSGRTGASSAPGTATPDQEGSEGVGKAD